MTPEERQEIRERPYLTRYAMVGALNDRHMEATPKGNFVLWQEAAGEFDRLLADYDHLVEVAREALRQIEALRTPSNRQGSPVDAFMDGVEQSAAILRALIDPATPEPDPGLAAIAGHVCPTCKRSMTRRARLATPEPVEGEPT